MGKHMFNVDLDAVLCRKSEGRTPAGIPRLVGQLRFASGERGPSLMAVRREL